MRPFLSSIFLVILISISFSQEKPFPHNIRYPYGFLSSNIKSENQETWYKNYKKYLKPCNGGLLPSTDDANTAKVEAQGWAMITAAYMGDKETFDGLYKYYQSKCTNQAGGMMAWRTNCGGFLDQGSATDGDLDVAYSLVVAHWQWPNEGYLDKAKKVINNCKKLIVNCGGISALAGGHSGSLYGGCNETDISYYTPAFFRVFAKVTGDAAWSKLADDTYIILNNCANATTGLVPDWHTVAGQPGPNGRNGSYDFDACRVPWRISLDYLWNGNEKALQWCKKVSDWAYKVGPENIKSGYQLNGTARGAYHNMAFVGSFAVSAMCNSQKIADDFAKETAKMKDDYWYSGYLGNCYLLTLTGNFWPCDSTPVKEKSVGKGCCTGIKFLHSSKQLSVSGLSANHHISIKDLCGRSITFKIERKDGVALIDLAALKSGCYIAQIGASQKLTGSHLFTVVK